LGVVETEIEDDALRAAGEVLTNDEIVKVTGDMRFDLTDDDTLGIADNSIPLTELDVVREPQVERLTGARRGVRSYDISRENVFFVVTEPENPYELHVAGPPFETDHRLTAHNASWLASKRLSTPEAYELTRDGVVVPYWIMKPAHFKEGESYPLLLQMHGGPSAMWGPGEASMWHEFQFFTSRGYGIVFSNPRGSGGYGYEFQRANYQDWGSGPAADVLAAASAAAQLPWVDSSRQVITGGSYAGYLTAWIVAHDDRFRAAVAQRGVYDLQTFLGEGNAWRLVPTHFGGYPWEETATAHDTLPLPVWQILMRNSPTTFVDNIRTPLLIIHGDQDLRTGVTQSEMLYRSLKILGRPVEYVRYPGAGHDLSRTGNPRQRMDRLLRIYEFMERFID
jgi:dipeptidyl aminopeptidase/acylaminoacyl peptidase